MTTQPYIRRVCTLTIAGALVALACRSQPPTSTTQPAAAAQASYDPANDPLVNPPSLLQPAPEDRSAVATDETLYRNLDGAPQNLNPIFYSSGYEMRVSEALFDGPFTWGADLQWRTNDVWVERYEESEDHVTSTLKLKPGLKWHDGHPITAHDIVFSWRNILDDRVPCPAVKSGTDQVANCEALDDLTVRYTYKEALATAKWNIIFPIIPKHVYEKEKEAHPDLLTGDYYENLNRSPIGCGPYKIVKWIEADRIEMERWEDYPGPKPYFKRLVFRLIADRNTSLLTLEKGDLDEVQLSDKQFAVDTVDSESFERVAYKALGPQWAFRHITWNMDGSNPFFNDRRVRRAMTHALDTESIIAKLLYNLNPPCHGIYHPDSWMYNPAVKDVLIKYDLERAAALLDEAKWTLDESDGWRYKTVNGQRVKFEFELLLPQGLSLYAEIAALFQQDLKRIGVGLKTRVMEWASFQQRNRKHEFQATTFVWGTGVDPDTGWNLWRTDQYEEGRNYGGYSNPEVDRLFEQSRHEFDAEKRRKLFQQIHLLVYEDQPLTFIHNQSTLWAFNRRIHGVQLSPRGPFLFDPSFMGWWVSAGQANVAAAMK